MPASAQQPVPGKTYKVGFSQIVDHPALNATRQGFIDGLAQAGFVVGKNLVLDYQNAQGDVGNARNIAQKFLTENVDLLARLDESVRTPAVITDTGSTKRQMAEAARVLPARFTFIGGHPLAGAAVGGLEHARPDLFKDRPWLFTPANEQGGAALARLIEFVSALGARPSVVGIDAHDRMLAYLSHLPQLTASALMDVVGSAVQEEGLALAGRGLIDTTRLASSPANIWKDIAETNADQVGAALDTLIALLQELRADLGKGERLTEVFQAANHWRQSLPK